MTMLSLLLSTFLAAASSGTPASTVGSWQTVRDDGAVGTLIVTDQHFALAWYEREPAKFISTEGGSWSRAEDGTLRLSYEFHTAQPALVGTTDSLAFQIAGNEMTAGGRTWKRIDDGAPGALQGSWLMTGRKRDGEISMRRPSARRTMKILSGTRFQWIAYNVETREFFGTGGGTYTTTVDGVYTETIEFFSRDNARAGRSLEFRYGLVDDAWHHDGKSTAGEPMYEIWEKRAKLGI
jgi:hypothetical protein